MNLPWSQHDRAMWAAHAARDGLDKWLRLVALAYSRHQENGHTPFERGELRSLLPSVDTSTGEVRPDKNLDRHIRQAVDLGFLLADSNASCLIVPHGVRVGSGVKAAKSCDRH